MQLQLSVGLVQLILCRAFPGKLQNGHKRIEQKVPTLFANKGHQLCMGE